MYLNDDRDDVAFLTGSGSSESERLYSKRDLYERGHVAVCSHKQAICITVFVFTTILLSSLAIAFVRPWNDCGINYTLEDSMDGSKTRGPPMATTGEVFPWDDVRLPIFIRPLSYDLELTPNLTTLAVKGIIKLIFQVTEETDFIVFHIKNIKITSKVINEKLLVKRLLEYPEREQMYLETTTPMKPGKTFSVRLKFEYNLTHSLEGFYLSTYKDKDGQEHVLATTHFEPTYARKAFPCFDEPQLKAEFTMTINHDRSMTAFFNMPVKEKSKVRGKPHMVRDEFQVTKKMSTYLVAFVICDFETVSEQTRTNNISVSVIASKDKIDQADFALHTAANITDYYETYFGINYPLPKQDLIAIPDFGAGAMENWGLITYRETSLLYKEGRSSASAQQWVAIVVAHELAHQWFGNLVTMKWWNDLWLNEGFASWMEYKGVAETQPNWAMGQQFWAQVMAPALKLDSLASSHPVSVAVNDPKEIEAIFDTISYKKGSSIIHMLEQYLGEETLSKGLNSYLRKHKFGNAITSDLWKSLSEATNGTKNVEEMMNTWTLQMGYPLITLVKGQNTSKGLTGWCVKQSRFLASGRTNMSTIVQKSKFNYTWFIPVNMMTDKSSDQKNILLNSSHNASNGHIELPRDLKWIKANLEGSGYYRVQYPIEIWRELIQQLHTDPTVFHPTDRAQLIDDAFCLCWAGMLDHDIPLSILEYLVGGEEDSLAVWSTALSHLTSWTEILGETRGRQGLERLVLHLIDKKYNKLGWEDTGEHTERLLRQKILKAAVDAGHTKAVDHAKELFQGLLTGKETIPANLQELVYSVGAREEGKEAWDWCWQRYTTTNIPSERRSLLYALGKTKDIFIIKRYLDMTLDKNLVKGQDVQTVISSLSANPTGTLATWRHIQRHWDTIFQMFHDASFTMGNIIHTVTAHFSSQFDFEQVQSFFTGRDVGAGKLVLKQSLEKMQVNIEFRRRSEEGVISWLDSKFGISKDS